MDIRNVEAIVEINGYYRMSFLYQKYYLCSLIHRCIKSIDKGNGVINKAKLPGNTDAGISAVTIGVSISLCS
jgi:hypothetical protein